MFERKFQRACLEAQRVWLVLPLWLGAALRAALWWATETTGDRRQSTTVKDLSWVSGLELCGIWLKALKGGFLSSCVFGVLVGISYILVHAVPG